MTELLKSDALGVARAASVLSQGGLVGMPTETVYGLGADACDDQAVARIFAAKGRPNFNPLIVHLARVEDARKWVVMPEIAERLAAAFWPGAMTLVLPMCGMDDLGDGAQPISSRVTAGLSTLAIRVPSHPVARQVLAAFGGPVAAPSANPSGRISPTRAAHVMAGLSGRIDAVLDGGDAPVGLESTIIGFDSHQRAVVLRAGSITLADIQSVIGYAPAMVEVHAKDAAALATDRDAAGASFAGTTPVVTAPGQMVSHYAPRGLVRLNATDVQADEIYLGFGPLPRGVAADRALFLSETGDLEEAAAQLFALFHHLDDIGATRIAVAPIPTFGIGQAINDRLRRAAAPR